MTDDIDATVGAAHAAETDEMDAEPNEEHENIAAHIKEHTGNDNESGDKEAATKTADGQDGSGSAASVIVGDRKDGADPKEFSENVPSSPQSKNENSEPQAPPNDVETDKLNDEESPTDTPNSGRKRPNENSEAKENDDNEPLPKLPLKKARSAYFIFADMKREELKQLHKGEGVAVLARATGQLWSALNPTEREEYDTLAAEERLRVSRDMQRLKDAGLWPEPDNATGTEGDGIDEDALVFPVARIRKICKLDPEVRGISKESAMLITKATELFLVKLGSECVTMAQMQNRRKLMPEDVVEVCSMKERFLFLKDDIKDLAKEQRAKEREGGRDGGKNAGNEGTKGKHGEEMGGKSTVKTLDSYFGKAR